VQQSQPKLAKLPPLQSKSQTAPARQTVCAHNRSNPATQAVRQRLRAEILQNQDRIAALDRHTHGLIQQLQQLEDRKYDLGERDCQDRPKVTVPVQRSRHRRRGIVRKHSVNKKAWISVVAIVICIAIGCAAIGFSIARLFLIE
jgi:hypothetical protein